ncbi:MAG TPA: hypothetical protein VG406_29225 [Isosphaeraceae bacterium]|jgi:hypothetical protein|nr:hypothetical protein [Isosphaeraceae bacterium]
MADKARSRFGVRLSTLLVLVAPLGVLTWGVRQSIELRRARRELAAARSQAEAARLEAMKACLVSEYDRLEAVQARQDAKDKGAGR